MFKGACLSLNINNSNAFLSRYVMLCYDFRHTSCLSRHTNIYRICADKAQRFKTTIPLYFKGIRCRLLIEVLM